MMPSSIPVTGPLTRSDRTIVDVKRIATSPFLRPMRRKVFGILRDAGLLTAVEPAKA